MLPKIRKTNAGSAPPLARPSIRPVAARKPPPPPAPPRKFPSGITPRGERLYDEDGDPATMMGFADPPTMSAPHAVPQAAPHRAPLVSFDEETQMRPVDDGLLAQSREDETWARVEARVEARVGAHGAPSEAPSTVPHFPEPAHAHARAHAHDLYEALPSLEVRRPFDTYEAEFAERDPATQLHAARHLHQQAPPTHREDSGARERPRKYAAPVPVYDDSVDSYRPEPEPRVELSEPAIPRAAAVPSVPDGFIVGVQPIRTPPGGALFPAHDAFAHHAPQHHAPQHQTGRSAPVPPATAAASPHAFHAPPYAQPYPQHQPQQQHYPAYTANAYTSGPRPALVAAHTPAPPPMQPVGHQIQTMPPPPSSSRTLRFAWFVFGVAFGIGFTFFASGVVPGVKKDEPAATFPPAPAVPTQVAQPVQAPPPPVAPLAATATATATAAPPPPAPAPLAAPPVLATAEPAPAPAPAPPPVVQAKAPPPPPPAAKVAAAPRTPPRRPAPPPQSAAPKALPNSGSVDSDSVASDTSSSSSAASKPAATASAEIPKDLFGAALNP